MSGVFCAILCSITQTLRPYLNLLNCKGFIFVLFWESRGKLWATTLFPSQRMKRKKTRPLPTTQCLDLHLNDQKNVFSNAFFEDFFQDFPISLRLYFQSYFHFSQKEKKNIPVKEQKIILWTRLHEIRFRIVAWHFLLL